MNQFDILIARLKKCSLCQDLPLGARPVLQISPRAQILIIGQAPGRLAHMSGQSFNDPSGDRLRSWMGIDRDIFYNPRLIALLPMGFCYPGTGKSGDLPPKPECATIWRPFLLAHLRNIRLTLVIGRYAHHWHLRGRKQGNLTQTVRDWDEYWPSILPLPHPSPRNNNWLKKNIWFERDILPALRQRVKTIIANDTSACSTAIGGNRPQTPIPEG